MYNYLLLVHPSCQQIAAAESGEDGYWVCSLSWLLHSLFPPELMLDFVIEAKWKGRVWEKVFGSWGQLIWPESPNCYSLKWDTNFFQSAIFVTSLGLCGVKDFQTASIFLLCLPCCVVYHLVQHCSLSSAILFAFQPAEDGKEERSRLPAFESISWKPSSRFLLLPYLSQHSQWP